MNGFTATLMGLVVVAGLSACSSDDDDEAMMMDNDEAMMMVTASQSLDPAKAIEAINSTSDEGDKAEKPEDGALETILERGEGIFVVSEGYNFKGTTAYVESTNPNVFTPGTYEGCNGLGCTITDPSATETAAYDLENFDTKQLKDTFNVVRAFLTKNEITTVEGRDSEEFGSESRLYGSWLEQSAFAVLTQSEQEVQEVGDSATVTVRTAFAGGNLTGDRPDEDATWKGLMVGTPAEGSQRGNILQGDAELVFDFGGETIDATFSNIYNLNQRALYRKDSVEFLNVRVDENGTYSRKNSLDDRIDGAFYGQGDDEFAETAGTFAKRGIVGAFGAKKQPAASQ